MSVEVSKGKAGTNPLNMSRKHPVKGEGAKSEVKETFFWFTLFTVTKSDVFNSKYLFMEDEHNSHSRSRPKINGKKNLYKPRSGVSMRCSSKLPLEGTTLKFLPS